MMGFYDEKSSKKKITSRFSIVKNPRKKAKNDSLFVIFHIIKHSTTNKLGVSGCWKGKEKNVELKLFLWLPFFLERPKFYSSFLTKKNWVWDEKLIKLMFQVNYILKKGGKYLYKLVETKAKRRVCKYLTNLVLNSIFFLNSIIYLETLKLSKDSKK